MKLTNRLELIWWPIRRNWRIRGFLTRIALGVHYPGKWPKPIFTRYIIGPFEIRYHNTTIEDLIEETLK